MSSRHRRRLGPALALTLVATGGTVATAGQGETARARESYNDGRIDDAIGAAEAVWRQTGTDAAAVVLARATLERFRQRESGDDLVKARDLLKAVDPSALRRSERVEWEIGIGASLYLEGMHGPASEVFDRVLREPGLPADDRDRLVDWWASAVDRVARDQPQPQRQETYARLVQRLELESGRDPSSEAGAYWLVAAARGAGHVERAWDLAVAGWVRAGPTRDALRSDLDRLVLQGVIPDLATARAGNTPEEDVAIWIMAELPGRWETVKAAWETGSSGP
jgi:hypothetical protein